jgi:sec-independent protein translocase protein TatB
MFDIGFSELLVIGIVALVVIGPERLPKVARTLGHLLGRAQRYVNDVKSDINREIQLDELKKLQTQVTESARSLESSVREEFDSARSAIVTPIAELDATARELAEGLPTAQSAETPATEVAPQASAQNPTNDKPAA